MARGKASKAGSGGRKFAISLVTAALITLSGDVLANVGEAGATDTGVANGSGSIAISSSKGTTFADTSASTDAIAIGDGAITGIGGQIGSGISAIAIGANSKAQAGGSMAFGTGAQATQTGNLALGNGATASVTNSVALGSSSVTAVGVNTTNATIGSITYGGFAGTMVGVVSVGSANAQRQIQNVAAGQVSALSTDAINGSQLFSGLSTTQSSITSLSTSTSTSLGTINSNVGSLSTSLSTTNNNVAYLSTALTPLTNAANAAIVSGGILTGTTIGGVNPNGTANTLGTDGNGIKIVSPATCSKISGIDATGSGLCVQATQGGATAYGSNAQATATNTTAFGFRAQATEAGSVAIGNNAQATGDPTVAIGQNSLASGNNAVAVGAAAQATATNSAAIGTSAQATGNNSVAIGANSVANQANTVSVGSVGAERTISNVAAGINPTDAVNVSQLSAVNNNVNTLRQDMYAASSAAIAFANLPQAYQPGQSGIVAAVGSYRGQGALAVGFSGISADGKWVSKASASADSRGNIGVGVGVFHPMN